MTDKPSTLSRTRREYELVPDDLTEKRKPKIARLIWVVRDKESSDDGYRVDLRSFLPRVNGIYIPLSSKIDKLSEGSIKSAGSINRVKEIKIERLRLLRELAPSIEAFTQRHGGRTAYEHLSTFRWFFVFLDEIASLLPKLPPDLRVVDLDERVGIEFADWLRVQKGIGAIRMASIYSAASSFVARASGKPAWRPCPFTKDASGDTALAYTEAQFTALLRLAKSVITKFMAKRRSYRLVQREIDRIDPSRKIIAYRAPTPERWKYQMRNRVIRARRALLAGKKPTSTETSWNSHCIAPSPEFVAAVFLLCMIRTGVNEQPLLDIKMGAWLTDSPFGARYRTITLWKNRTGSQGKKKKKRIPLTVPWKPTFYPAKLLRYQELLGNWCRKVISSRKRHGAAAMHNNVTTRRAAGQFWIYWTEQGHWSYLNGTSTHRLINKLIEDHAAQWQALRGRDGEPLRYSAKALRDAYLEFSIKTSGFSIPLGQQELAHSKDSSSIHGYLSKPWARTYAHAGMRRLHTASIAILSSTDQSLSPSTLREILQPDRNPDTPAGQASGLVKVQNGFWCKDSKNPPPEIYQPKDGEDCPAEHCHDCYLARCFKSSLPELAREILNLRSRRDQISLHLWQGSEGDEKLQKLEDMTSRFNAKDVAEAYSKAEWLDAQEFPYFPGS
jgi:hypothetical protein